MRAVALPLLVCVSEADYQEYSGKTCWNGHGAVEIDSDDTAQENIDADACKSICDDDDSCDCVAYGVDSRKCWRRKECDPPNFGPDDSFTVFVKDGDSPSGPPEPPQPEDVSIRVTKGLGSRGYGSVRVSAITKGSAPEGEWDYSSQFVNCDQNNARDFYISTKLIDVKPGKPKSVKIAGNEIQIKIPKQNEGSVGLLIADPCIYGSKWCAYADTYDIKGSLQRVLNAMAKNDELDYWMNIGDLFYDQDGSATSDFFSGLTLETAAKIHGMTMGNHDYWQNGDPGSASGGDSFGNFHMQWYAQDAMSAKEDQSNPFDFSQAPQDVAAHTNFQWYNMVGNVAFIGFSNQNEWDDQADFFQEFCDYAQEQDAALLVMLGHWHNEDMGCAAGLDTPEAYSKLMSIDSCSQFGNRVKFFEGHRHCNFPVQDDVGFMVGSFGMGGGGCQDSDTGDGAFGLPILDTRGDVAKLYYFELGKFGGKTDNFDSLLTCLEEKGVSGCTGEPGVQTWFETPMSKSSVII